MSSIASSSNHSEPPSEEEAGPSRWEPDEWNDDDSVDSASDESDVGTIESPELDAVPSGLHSDLSTLPLDVLAKARRVLQRRREGSLDELDEPPESGPSRSRRNPRDTSRGIASGAHGKSLPSRSSKHAPTVMSSKRQIGRARQTADIKQRITRDPRFGSDTDPSAHGRTALAELLRSEYSELQTSLQTVKVAEQRCRPSERDHWTQERSRLEARRDKVRSKLAAIDKSERDRRALASVKKEERDRQTQGKNPWYMKKSEKRDVLLSARFDDLRQKGGKRAVQKVVEKKRRKEAAKEKKSRPTMIRKSRE